MRWPERGHVRKGYPEPVRRQAVHWAEAWRGRTIAFRAAVPLNANVIHLINEWSFTNVRAWSEEDSAAALAKDLSDEYSGNGTAPQGKRNSTLKGWPNSQGKLAWQL